MNDRLQQIRAIALSIVVACDELQAILDRSTVDERRKIAERIQHAADDLEVITFPESE